MTVLSYQYCDLPSQTSIRLLQIVSGVDEPIRLSLKTVTDLEHDVKPYDCLSYTWADPLYHNLSAPSLIRRTTGDRNINVECDGKVLQITENLKEALLQLTRNGISSNPGDRVQWRRQPLIWIDALCINQKNSDEKGSQVQMMSEIYRLAKTVIVWLGVGDMHTNITDSEGKIIKDIKGPAIEVVDRLASIPPEKRHVQIPRDLSDPEVYRILEIEYIEPQSWLSYGAFLQRTWFSRVWVLQETFFAQEIVVFCGCLVIAWSDITVGTHVLKNTVLGDLLVVAVKNATDQPNTSMSSIGNVIVNQLVFENMRAKADSLNLEKLLVYSRYFNATQNKDHIYALLGMWKQSLIHKATPETITPKYNKEVSVEQVFTEASWAILSEMADLNILSLVEDRSVRTLYNLPSWVPDYSVIPQAHPLVGNPRALPGKERWHASAGLKWDCTEISNWRKSSAQMLLPVESICVDTIVECAATLEEITDHYALMSLLKLFSNALHAADNQKKITESFWRGLIKDTFDDSPADISARAAFPLLIALYVMELEQALTNLRHASPAPTPGEFEPLSSFMSDVNPTAMPNLSSDPNPVAYLVLPEDPTLEQLESVLEKTKALVEELAAFTNLNGKTDESLVNRVEEEATTVQSFLDPPGGIIPRWSAIQSLISTHLSDDDAPEDEDLHTAVTRVYTAFEAAYAGRRLFRTAKSNYIGIGPRSLEEGDSIWVLAGADVPMVLTQREVVVGGWKAGGVEGHSARWRLVGEAFVLDLMDGEAVRRKVGKEGRRGLEKIYLE